MGTSWETSCPPWQCTMRAVRGGGATPRPSRFGPRDARLREPRWIAMTRASHVLGGPSRTKVSPEPKKPFLERMLDGIERVGNKVPHPAVIFAVLIGLVIIFSHIFYLLGA